MNRRLPAPARWKIAHVMPSSSRCEPGCSALGDQPVWIRQRRRIDERPAQQGAGVEPQQLDLLGEAAAPQLITDPLQERMDIARLQADVLELCLIGFASGRRVMLERP